METVITAIATVSDLVVAVWDMMLENPMMTVFMAASLVTVGFKVFKKGKGVAKS